jgi:hypothetical protein
MPLHDETRLYKYLETDLMAVTLEQARADRKVIDLGGAACELAMAGLRQRHTLASAAELRKRFAALTLGREASIALFGRDPRREGW